MSKAPNTGIGSLGAMRAALSRFVRGSGSTHGGARDVWGTLGYPESISITDYWVRYLRGGIATRIVTAHSSATWREQPLIRDEKGSSDEDSTAEDFSPFVESVNQLLREFTVLSALDRADRLSGIGRFGVLLMGFADGKTMNQPLTAGKYQLMYLQPYGEPHVTVQTLDQNTASPRYGLPETYQISPGAMGSVTSGTTSGTAHLPAQIVHWTRVIHVAEKLDSDNVYGRPVLQSSYNHLMDLEKVLGSSAETFWLNARGGLSLSVDADAELTPEASSALKEQAEEYEHQLRRILMMQGVTAQALTTNVADPSPNAERLLDVISGSTGIPKRILIGSERGELSSSQDENNWGQRIDERQNLWATPMVLKPFIEKMIETGNVLAPQGDWWIEWPASTTLSPERQSEIGLKRTQALASYSNSPMSQIVVPHSEFRQEFLGLTSTTSFDEKTTTLPPFVEDEEAMAEFERLYGKKPPQDDQSEPAPPPAPADGAPVDDTPADSAMNGSQIASLRTIVESVGAGILPIETAVKLILVGFPSVSEEMARAILQPMEGRDLDPADLPTPEVVANTVSSSLERMLAVVGASEARALRVNARPRSLVVLRPVLNAAEIREHYRAQGFTSLVPEDELHVTVVYSRKPVDWIAMPPLYGDLDDAERHVVPEGGARLHEMFGDAAVLCFTDYHVMWRHEDLVMSGASSDHPQYHPHVTLSYVSDGSNPDVLSAEPWTGRIELGPEEWTEVSSDWSENLEED